MNCPVCDARLREIQKHGVEIDICPECKGVWLDRGELEKIIAMEAAGGPVTEPEYKRDQERHRLAEQPRDREEYRRSSHNEEEGSAEHQYDQQGRPARKKRESWFGEIFEMFGD
ncbi:MAG: TFIIB-type zinc ribbon-containing protein [Armatimonadota bacterium]